MIEIFDIADVCTMLGTTSRTLRFYEQKGIIQSSVQSTGTRRRYSTAQIEQIKKVMILRSLGLQISHIQQLQHDNKDLSSVIEERRAQLLALMVTKTKELNLLEEALATVRDGKSIEDILNSDISCDKIDSSCIAIAQTCTDAFLSGNYESIFAHFSENLRNYLPLSSFEIICADTLKPLGYFIKKEKTVSEKGMPNIVISYLKYEKIGLYIKYVFHNKEIHGIWMNYQKEKLL